jgi:flavodoxin
MRALVVHESMFGNTTTVARAIAAGLNGVDGVEADLVAVRDAPVELADIDLVVVGGPTHAFGMSRASTRRDAEDKGADAAAAHGVGIREWIDAVRPKAGVVIATFDTRVRRPRVPGSAARAARKHLRTHGFKAIEPATSFWVDGTSGPLHDGEEDRARLWGADLASAMAAHEVTPT